MDRLIMILSHANVEVLKEPRGFVKFLQIIIAICAFATAVSNTSLTAFEVRCDNQTTERVIKLNFSYPYNIHETTKFNLPMCSAHHNSTGACFGDFSASSQFFVFVGVTAFLCCLSVLIFYVLADDKYHQIPMIPTVDFIITLVYACLWFVSSSAWADAVVKIKHYTDPDVFLKYENPYNEENFQECFKKNIQCSADGTNLGDYRNMNISIVLGYLCTVVWAGNLWFLFKETKWGKGSNVQQSNSQSMPPSSPSSAI